MKLLLNAKFILAAAMFFTAACSEPPVAPVQESDPKRSQTLSDGRFDQVSLTDPRYASLVGSDSDWTGALQLAVNEAHNVYVPAGTYALKSVNASALILGGASTMRAAIALPSNTRVFGDGGASRLVSTTSDAGIFMGGNAAGGSVTNITVENLALSNSMQPPPAGETYRAYALWTRRGTNISVRNDSVTNLGIYSNDHLLEEPDSYLGVPASGYPGNITVSGNRGTGRSSLQGYSDAEAIVVGFADGVTITDNIVRHYMSGIQWWGGDWRRWQDPSAPTGSLTNPRKVRNLTIRGNAVTYTHGGIWGTMGENILVESNSVSECSDVCLDSEGDKNARFQLNTASYARAGVLAVFGSSRDVVFYWNTVVENGGNRSASNGERVLAGNRSLFSTSSGGTSGTGVRIELSNNTFEYTGTGVGLLRKTAGEALNVTANTLRNVAIAFHSDANGEIKVNNNTLSFDRLIGSGDLGWGEYGPLPAIYVTNTETATGSAPTNSQWSLEVFNNKVVGLAGQDQYANSGIRVREENIYAGSATHRISNNRIRNLSKSVEVIPRANSSTKDVFQVDNNGGTAAVSGLPSIVTTFDNYQLYSENVAYRVHGPTYADWQDSRYGNETAGTVGEGRSLDALSVQLADASYASTICYRVHVSGVGWSNEACGGAVAGTLGTDIEAVQIRLINPLSGSRVCYAAHSASIGWQSEVCNYAQAGVVGQAKSMQAIRVRVYR